MTNNKLISTWNGLKLHILHEKCGGNFVRNALLSRYGSGSVTGLKYKHANAK